MPAEVKNRTAPAVPLERLLPRVRVALGQEEITLRDRARVRTAVDLLRALDVWEANGAEVSGNSGVRTLVSALHGFMRALLGSETNAEVIGGLVHVMTLNLAAGRASALASPDE